MLIETWQDLFTRDLNKLNAEIELNQNEENTRHIEKGALLIQQAIFVCI
jgi:hypothetical protein